MTTDSTIKPLLDHTSINQCKQLANSTDLQGKRAKALLLLNSGESNSEAAKKSGLTVRQVSYLLGRFKKVGMALFIASSGQKTVAKKAVRKKAVTKKSVKKAAAVKKPAPVIDAEESTAEDSKAEDKAKKKKEKKKEKKSSKKDKAKKSSKKDKKSKKSKKGKKKNKK